MKKLSRRLRGKKPQKQNGRMDPMEEIERNNKNNKKLFQLTRPQNKLGTPQAKN